MSITLDHVGYVTNNLRLFEEFWVDILGFEKEFESIIPPVMNNALFKWNGGAYCARYTNGEFTLEVHVYDGVIMETEQSFQQFGLNHIALHVENRKEFLKKHFFKTHIYHNPKGWDNIFIEDFEGNWIELRETL